MNSHHNGTFECEWCGKFFAYEKNLSRHKMIFCPRRPSMQQVTSGETNNRPAVSVANTGPTTQVSASGFSASPHVRDSEQPTDIGTQQLRKMLLSKYPASSDDGRQYYCDGCQYVPNCTFTQHVRDVHTGVFVPELSNLSSSHPRYCDRCDITFRSTKNFQIHKHYFCNSRPVYELPDSSFQAYTKTLNDVQQRQLRKLECQSAPHPKNHLFWASSTSEPVNHDMNADQNKHPFSRTSSVASDLNDVAGFSSSSTFLLQTGSTDASNCQVTSSTRLNPDSIIATLPRGDVSTEKNLVAVKPRSKSSAQIVFLSSQKSK